MFALNPQVKLLQLLLALEIMDRVVVLGFEPSVSIRLGPRIQGRWFRGSKHPRHQFFYKGFFPGFPRRRALELDGVGDPSKPSWFSKPQRVAPHALGIEVLVLRI
jgi:hypothetical protein